MKHAVKKVSIAADNDVTVRQISPRSKEHPANSPRNRENALKPAASTSNVNNAGENGILPPSGNLASNCRTSLFNISAEKRARKVRFFINNDKFFKGATIAVSAEKFRTLEKLLEHLTRIMSNQVTLPNGVRFIYALDGKNIVDVSELSHEANYVCSSNTAFKRLDYVKLAANQDSQQQWNRLKKENYLSVNDNYNEKSRRGLTTSVKRDNYKNSGHAKTFGESNNDQMAIVKPKIVAVLRSGRRPRKAVRVLLNHRNAKTFEGILSELTSTVKLDAGAVRKVFGLSGKAVLNVSDFKEEEVFMAYGGEKCQSEDFELDLQEFRMVQAILKSPELDAKYEKFAAMETNHRQSKKSKLPMKNAPNFKTRKSSASKTRGESPSSNMIVGTSIVPNNLNTYKSPKEIGAKYLVGDIIGDGNFAVVRKCFSKKAKTEFALKIIDKSKCAGKEHMIESEVSILNAVSHPNIIELVEVFDLPGEKYLVTEYVRGGDLFDAIAADTKYTELVSKGMVRDLTSALKYLHDKMIVHRDIKPENLLVVDYPSQGLKSLKLGDFGLAQIVSEPLFTGTDT